MKIHYGDGRTEYGPGIQISLEGDEIARAIDAWLVSQGVAVRGPRTIRVNGEMIEDGGIYVDPSGFVVNDGEKLSGRGPAKEAAFKLGHGTLGNGITVWNSAREVNGDYGKVAHIDPFRKITYYIDNIPEKVKAYVEAIATGPNPSVSVSQPEQKVFREEV